ncbi:hypothetical protein CWI82_01160 [Pseudidiomarina tainanensis]|uniref:Uncharacterized protein n=1 Tax=Pseudidiomarina tainanensis TaxID=502365 RepID=A0ACD2HHB8_9GAMM|nr:hypothetical protein CWI82_01160 [Pseudidiomarina tainanensis]
MCSASCDASIPQADVNGQKVSDDYSPDWPAWKAGSDFKKPERKTVQNNKETKIFKPLQPAGAFFTK